MSSIRLEGVSKRYGDTKAADGLDLEIRDGEYLCVLGPTGAGKTTLLRVLCGLVHPDSGRVLFDGKDVTDSEPEDRGAVMLSQTYSLFPQLTVAENIVFGPSIRGWSQEEKDRALSAMLDMVRLIDRAEAYPRELSGGMQQRTALARALASGSNILLLDEPLRALDARLRISLRHEVRDLAKSMGLTTIHVTHDQDEAMVMADRIAVIRGGKIVQVGTPNDVFDHPNSPFVANFVGQSNFFRGEVKKVADITEVKCDFGGTVEARPSHQPVGSKVLVSIKVGNTEIVKEGNGFMPGTIERILFEGRNLHVDINVEGLGRISSKVPSWRSNKLAIGDVVQVRWNAEKAHVFPMPSPEILKELKVD